MTREICECGHELNEHDFDDDDLGCSECNCPMYVEQEEE